jgi:transcriptional regulator GlxA family with amidase domain
MIPYERRKSEQPAPAVSEISNKVIRQTIRVFETTMEDPPSLSEVARKVGITSRQLERIFRDELGTSPSRIRDKLRVQRAKQLLVETDLNFTEVAVACNMAFQSIEKFHYDRPPRDLEQCGNQRSIEGIWRGEARH